MADELQRASQFWERYGIRFNVVNRTEDLNPAYKSPNVNTVNAAVDAYAALYPNTVIMMGVNRFSDETTPTNGITSRSRNGFATRSGNSPFTVAHEMGHVMWGLNSSPEERQ